MPSAPGNGVRPRGPRRALREAGQRPHAEVPQLALVEYFEVDAEVGEMLAAFDEAFGIKDIRRLGDERLGQRDTLGDRFIFGPAVRKVAVRRGDGHRLEARLRLLGQPRAIGVEAPRSEEHTSELQSLMRISYAVFCLKKKTQ